MACSLWLAVEQVEAGGDEDDGGGGQEGGGEDEHGQGSGCSGLVLHRLAV
jgi:hypothetical protein